MPRLVSAGTSPAADELLGLILRAAVAGEEPVIRIDDLGGTRPSNRPWMPERAELPLPPAGTPDRARESGRHSSGQPRTIGLA